MNPAAVSAWVGLGGNLDDVAATFQRALGLLDALPDTRLLRCSRNYRTPAWGPVPQPAYLNAVCELETRLPAERLMRALLDTELACGRDRDAPGALRWGPRTLDLDLLLYGEACVDEPGLNVPHPRLHERAFVLAPLAELAPGLSIPGRGRVSDLLAGLDAEGVQALP
jgi:2-amino-4-hydroxy-6-hydroxymethyldihydropteridine diphosphokinase